MQLVQRIKKNELGRSMVEILGVLAVIGVLSTGGIQGYKYAMDKHRANDIVNEVNMRATDIWHLYQDGEKELPDSPDADAFPEYGEKTQTGFEIMVTSHPPVAFRTWVNNVPSDVCKKVLQENLNEAITGLRFVQVNGNKYADDINICGEDVADNQMVFTSFLDEGGGAVGGPTDEEGRLLEQCVDDEDCPQECGGAVCDERTMTCQDGCTGTDKPYCMRGSGTCVECRVNDDCAYKGRGWICDESNFTCTALQKTCPEGTFRSQNGACIKCDDGSNFFVLKDGQGFPDTSDEVDGYTMCGECEASGTKRWRGELTDDTDRGYCSFMCTEGYSYQSESEGCISCSDMRRHNIKNESISKAQCLACEGHVWYQSYLGGFWCQAPVECADDEFMYQQWGGNWGYYCTKCTNNRSNGVMMEWVSNSSISGFVQSMKDICNACPERNKNGVWSKRWAMGGTCMPTCEQPENADEQIEICKTNPNDEKCTRKWQNKDAACFSCNQITNASKVGTDSTLKKLCESCGRRVNSQGYCVPGGNVPCEIGKFLGVDGSCHSCSKNSYVQIESEEVSGCAANCNQDETGAYTTNGNIATRFSKQLNKDEGYYANGAGLYCFPKCGEKAINIGIYYGSGKCQSCNDPNTKTALNPMWIADCDKCPYLDVYAAHGTFCSPVCPEGYYKNRLGTCVSCSRNNSGDDDYQGGANGSVEGVELCNACGNRMIVNSSCRLVNPGVTGICNSVGNNYNANLTSELKIKAEPYINGDNDGIYYRSNDGYCRRCDSDASYTSTQAQCASCKNRRYEGGNCLKGLCAEGKHFLNTNATCVSCTSKNVAVNPDATNLCDSCENRRMLTTGFEEQGNWKGLCVEDCPSGMWQGKNGTCYFCEENSTQEIGTDAESVNMCQTVCGREVILIENDNDEIIGYKCALKENSVD